MSRPQDPEHRVAAQLLAAQRAGCLTRLSRLEHEFAGIVETGAGGTDDEHHPEGPTLAFERQHLGALISDVRRHLAQIDAAAGRLDDGSYGICENCGQPIGSARLSARPAATTCIGCAGPP